MSEFKLSGRKIDFFRCHIDPSIGPKPRNAFKVDEMKMEAEITPIGVYTKLPDGTESIVPFPNIQSIRLKPLLSVVEETKDKKANKGA